MRSIVDEMDAPDLFGPFFQGGSFTAWRAFLVALFALPMDVEARAIYQRHTERLAPPAEPAKEAALDIGRRGGKSRFLALIATYLATGRDYRPYLEPGEVATIAVIASDQKQARGIFRYVKGLLAAVPLMAETIEDEGAESVTLSNRVVIEIHTASFRVTRGYTFAAVLADKTAFWRDENSANPDAEIFRALRPA